MDNWIECLLPILQEYAGEEALDGDGVDGLCEIINLILQFHQGNITIEAYENRIKQHQQHWCDVEAERVKNTNSNVVGVELLIQSFELFSSSHKLGWDVFETIRYSKK